MKTDAWLRAFVFCGLRLWSSFCVFCVWTVRARSSKLEHKIFARFLLSKIVIFHLTHLRFSTTPQGVRTTPQGVRPLKGCAPSRGAPPQGVRPLKGCKGAPPQDAKFSWVFGPRKYLCLTPRENPVCTKGNSKISFTSCLGRFLPLLMNPCYRVNLTQGWT